MKYSTILSVFGVVSSLFYTTTVVMSMLGYDNEPDTLILIVGLLLGIYSEVVED